MGRRRGPARARPPRLRHGRREPVPLPAALAQRGPRGLPQRGLRRHGDRGTVETPARDGTLIPLDGLDGQFPTTAERFFLAYAESVERGRLPDPDPRPGCARVAHPLVRRRPHRRRGVQRPRSGWTRRHSTRPGCRPRRRRRRSRYGPQPAPAGPAARRPGRTAGARQPRSRPARSGLPGATAAPASPARAGPDATVGGAPVALIVVVLVGVGAWSSPSAWLAAAVGPADAVRRDPDGPAAGHPELADHARGRAARARVPRRGPARRRGPAGPLHDPGARAARRDRDRAPGPAGGAQGQRARAARADPGDRERRARGRRRRQASSTTSSSRRASRRASSRSRDRHRAPARGLARARRARRPTRRTTSSARATCARSSRSCGRPGPRRSRSTASA